MIYGLALCAGGGGLELGLALALGDRYRAVCYVEREAYPAAVLAARMDAGHLAPAPIWDDVTTFDGERWRGSVDCVTAGFPCQRWSIAAKRSTGTSDERWIWPDIAAILRQVRPRIVYLENVPPFVVRGGLRLVLADLAELGFNVAWDLFRASAVGGSHRRERLFILALADADGQRLQGQQSKPATLGGDLSSRPSSRATVARCIFPPGPQDLDVWVDVLAERPEVAPAIESGVRRVVDAMAAGLVDRRHRLRVLGNGVVPLQAAVAFRLLCDRLEAGE